MPETFQQQYANGLKFGAPTNERQSSANEDVRAKWASKFKFGLVSDQLGSGIKEQEASPFKTI